MVDCYERRFRVARKVHHCEFCNGEVQPGELHQVETGLYDHEWFRRRLHMHCAAALDEMLSSTHDDEFTWTGLHDWLVDNVCFDCRRRGVCRGILPNCLPCVIRFSQRASRPEPTWVGP